MHLIGDVKNKECIIIDDMIDTAGTLNVLNLVAGTAAVVESPSDAFAPFEVHYAETFVIPAALGRYRLRSLAPPGATCAVMRAWVRPTGQ